ncbi:MAG: hypothetical protein QF926_01200 [Alphaproteobacteria bacterium]|jgi:hypothetical protein|nr:hypothetical protein [Alphaproteobacteria bacterium]MDP6515226.1 hypothetical protein [Alphaproteobacteria bacterium]
MVDRGEIGGVGQRRIARAPLILGLGLGGFPPVWGLEKPVIPERTVRV